MRRKIWTEQEIEILKRDYPNKTNKELLSVFNVNINQLNNKAGEFKLNKTKDTLSISNSGHNIEVMKANNPMKNKEIIEKMRQSKIRFHDNLRKQGIKQKRKTRYNVGIPIINLEDKKEFIIEKYKSGLTLRQVGNLLGVSTNTIKRRMIKWGISRRTGCKYSNFHKSRDGHVVKSGMELEMDDWLFNNRIAHIYEKRIGETKFLCDFYIPDADVYIEIFGLTDDIYKERMKRKIKAYEELGIIDNLLIVLPKDKFEDKLKFLLKYSKIQRRIDEYEK